MKKIRSSERFRKNSYTFLQISIIINERNYNLREACYGSQKYGTSSNRRKNHTLGGYESEEYFQKVASYINNKIAELSEMPGYTRQPVETKHTLLSLNVTDDYFKAKKQAEIFEQDLQQKDQEMYELKHELIALRNEIRRKRKKISESEHG